MFGSFKADGHPEKRAKVTEEIQKAGTESQQKSYYYRSNIYGHDSLFYSYRRKTEVKDSGKDLAVSGLRLDGYGA